MNLERIIKLLKPKYYNRITYVLIFTGCSILTSPIWLDILNSILETNNENFKKITFTVIGKYDWILGIGIIILALIYNTIHRILELKSTAKRVPEHENVKSLIAGSFEKLSAMIYPLLKDNEYIFKTLGPNSYASAIEELRTDLTMWYKYRSEAILPNNEKIKELLKTNYTHLDRESKKLSDKMILHIDEFKEHTVNPDFDYSQFQFPKDFQALIEQTCFSHSISSKKLKDRKNWLAKKIGKLNPKEWYIIGSTLFVPDKAKDIDIVVLFEDFDELKHKKLEHIKFDFRMKFKVKMHDTIFVNQELMNYKEFLGRNKYKLKGNG